MYGKSISVRAKDVYLLFELAPEFRANRGCVSAANFLSSDVKNSFGIFQCLHTIPIYSWSPALRDY